MSNATYYVLSFLVIYLVIFILHYFFLTKPAIDEILGKKKKSKKGKKKEIRKIGEVEYLVNKFKLDRNSLNYNSLNIVGTGISSIITDTKVIIKLFNNGIITFRFW